MPPNDGWSEYEKLVLDRLDRMEAQNGKLEEKIEKLILDVHLLKFKMGMYGAIGAAVVVLSKHLIDKI